MLSIDDLLELDEANTTLKQWSQKLHDSVRNENQEEYDRLLPICVESKSKLNDMLKDKGIHINSVYSLDYNISTVKDKWLEELVSEHHISQMGEEPDKYFKKLIQLFGEKKLSSFSYSIYDDEISFDDIEEDDDEIEYFDEDDYDNSTTLNESGPQHIMTYDILQFINGEEDKVIKHVKTNELRKKVLASKLINLWDMGNDSIQQLVEEYSEYSEGKEKIINGFNLHDEFPFFISTDEFGYLDITETINNFTNLPISKDPNFYLYLVKYGKKLGIPLETLSQYLLDDEKIVSSDISSIYETGKVEEWLNRNKSKSSLQQREKELSSLEKEAKTIDEAEALIDQQRSGQNIGEE